MGYACYTQCLKKFNSHTRREPVASQQFLVVSILLNIYFKPHVSASAGKTRDMVFVIARCLKVSANVVKLYI